MRDAVAALHHRDYAVFWVGALLSNTGSWMQRATVPFVLYRMTGSATWVGVAAFLQFAPGVALGPLGGSLADRHDRRRLLVVTQVAMGALALAMWALFVTGRETPVAIVVLVTLGGIGGGLNLPAWQSFISDLVPRDLLLNAITLNSTQFNAARAVGPALAGVALAAGGPAWAFLVNALSYLAVLGALALIREAGRAPNPLVERQPLRRELAGTVAYVRSVPGIAAAIRMALVVGCTGAPVFSLLSVFADDVFHVGDAAYGLMGATMGIGAVLGAPLIAAWGGRQPRSRMAAIAATGYGAGLVGLALAPHYVVGLVALAVLGASHLANASALNTTVQLLVDESRRGRVMAVYLMALMGSVPIGSLAQGALIDVAGPRATVATAGLVLLGSVIQMRAGGRLRAMDAADANQRT